MYNNLYASWHITISIQINLLLVVEVDLLQSWMIMDQTICHSVVNDLICHSVWKYEVDFFLSLRLFSKAVIINFCHFLKWLTCNFSTWRDQWPVLPIYSVSSCPACTHLDSVIGDAQRCVFPQWALRTEYLWGFFRLSFLWYVPASAVCIDEALLVVHI